MPINSQKRQHSTLRACESRKHQRGVLRLSPDQIMKRTLRHPIFVSVLCMMFAALPCAAQNAVLKQLGIGIAISGASSPFSAGFGNVNGLGIAVPATLTNIAITGASAGQFYYTPYTLAVSGAGGGTPALVKAYLSSGFTNPSAILELRSCPNPNACTTVGSYTALPNSQATEVTVLPNQTSNGNYTAHLGLFVANANGTTSTSDSAQVTFDIYDGANNKLKHTIVLNLSVTALTAVQLQLATATSGMTITSNSPTIDPNFTANFGTVNGLGVGIASPFTLISGQSPGGIIYATPYQIQPAFSGFTSANATKISVYISTDFTHSNVLTLYDSATQLTGYTAIGKSSGSAHQITASAGNGTAITEYLGLFVSNLNGGTSYRGSDQATLTYTITVQ